MNPNKNKTKTKTAMLQELESIKGLLLEEDDIPILQEEIEQSDADIAATKLEREEHQQDFFDNPTPAPLASSASVQKTTVAPNETIRTPNARAVATKVNGENPFLPEHIRSRLHGNNPPPSFAIEAAKKIASVSKPKTLLGRTDLGSYERAGFDKNLSEKNLTEKQLIDDIVNRLLPVMEKELREKLEVMSKRVLEDILASKR